MDPSIRSHLIDEAKRQRLTLFIGANLDQTVTGIPGSQLQAQSIQKKFDVSGASPQEGLSNMVQAAGRLRYQPIIQHLRDLLDTTQIAPQPFDLMTAQLPVSTFLTTRMDALLTRAFEMVERPVQSVVTDFDAGFVTGDRATLVRIYGELAQPASLILNQDDLFDLPQRKRQITLLMEQAMSSSTLLFLGVDLTSPDFLALWRGVLRSLGRFAPMAYAALPAGNPTDDQKSLWLERNISLLDDAPLAVVQILHRELEPVGSAPTVPVTSRATVPATPPFASYQNFDLELSTSNTGQVQARVLRSPAGEAQAFSPMIAGLNLASASLADFSQRGRDLGRLLLPASVGARWAASQTLTAQNDEGLRLRLFFPQPPQQIDLAGLPWELAQAGDQRLALRPQSPMVRYVNAPRPGDALDISGPLRLLVLTSHVEDPDLPALALEEELSLMQEALAPLVANGSVQVHWPQSHRLTRRDLMDQLRQVRPHLLHYIGHGLYDDASQSGYLLLSESTSSQTASPVSTPSVSTPSVSTPSVATSPTPLSPTPLSMEELGLLLDGGSVQFGFFNACSSGAAAGGIAQSAVQAVLPAALGMQVDAPDDAAAAFAGAFYRALADRWPVDAAVVEGRRLLAGEFGLDSGWWGLPALYTRLEDGQLFR